MKMYGRLVATVALVIAVIFLGVLVIRPLAKNPGLPYRVIGVSTEFAHLKESDIVDFSIQGGMPDTYRIGASPEWSDRKCIANSLASTARVSQVSWPKIERDVLSGTTPSHVKATLSDGSCLYIVSAVIVERKVSGEIMVFVIDE